MEELTREELLEYITEAAIILHKCSSFIDIMKFKNGEDVDDGNEENPSLEAIVNRFLVKIKKDDTIKTILED